MVTHQDDMTMDIFFRELEGDPELKPSRWVQKTSRYKWGETRREITTTFN